MRRNAGQAVSAPSWTREARAGIGAEAGRPGRLAARWIVHRALRFLMLLFSIATKVAGRLGPGKRRRSPDGAVVLVTATFYSDNWLASHLRPLAASAKCRQVLMVSAQPVPPIDKVVPILAPGWLVRVTGKVPARLLTFLWTGIRRRPDVVGGFHLLVNGLVASLLARVIGARSLYFCGGGPTEVAGGGHLTENRLFRRLETPDEVVERRLVDAVRTFDCVVAMGSSAVDFFRARGVETKFRIIPGGKDATRYRPSGAPPTIDLVTVGRLSAVKRIDVFLHVVRLLRERFPEIRAAVVGDGPLRGSLEDLSRELGLEKHVSFVGQQPAVEPWLKRARIFVLTSDSEGLSLALMEAMMCGLTAVVSRVGDLGDLVEDGVNGFLVDDRAPESYAAPIAGLLEDPAKLSRFSQGACDAAGRYEIGKVARQWDEVLAST